MRELLDGLGLLFFVVSRLALLVLVVVALPLLFIVMPDWIPVVIMSGVGVYFLWTKLTK